MSLDWMKKRNARNCREKSVTKQKINTEPQTIPVKATSLNDEFTDIKSFKERVNDFIELVEKDNARRIRIDFNIEWEKD
jgi:hypothetical protein